MKIKFWGVRGTVPCPGVHTAKYGGNSSCIQVIADNHEKTIIIDAGSGIRDLGNDLMANKPNGNPLDILLFLSHTHWDHIMGFPFFTPIYVPTTKMSVYGPVTFEDDPLVDVVGGQMKYRYFPVNIGELSSHIEYVRLREEPFIDLGSGVTMSTKLLNHSITTLGYRIECNGKVLCTCYDYEPYRNLFISDPEHPEYDEAMAYEGGLVAEEQNGMVEQFFQGADLLIHDSQYTLSEYDTKVGWGHSPMEHAIDVARRTGVKKLALFHHDPERTDEQLDELAEIYCSPGGRDGLEIFFAKENMIVDV